MPQMAPMNWLTLFIMFVLTLMVFCSLNYFSFLYKNSSKMLKLTSKKKINWKW